MKKLKGAYTQAEYEKIFEDMLYPKGTLPLRAVETLEMETADVITTTEEEKE